MFPKQGDKIGYHSPGHLWVNAETVGSVESGELEYKYK
jgi:hypothetical protein